METGGIFRTVVLGSGPARPKVLRPPGSSTSATAARTTTIAATATTDAASQFVPDKGDCLSIWLFAPFAPSFLYAGDVNGRGPETFAAENPCQGVST